MILLSFELWRKRASSFNDLFLLCLMFSWGHQHASVLFFFQKGREGWFFLCQTGRERWDLRSGVHVHEGVGHFAGRQRTTVNYINSLRMLTAKRQVVLRVCLPRNGQVVLMESLVDDWFTLHDSGQSDRSIICLSRISVCCHCVHKEKGTPLHKTKNRSQSNQP